MTRIKDGWEKNANTWNGEEERLRLRLRLSRKKWLPLPPAARGLFLLIPCKSLQKKQTFEMTPLKNGIRLTVNGLGVPPPFLKKPSPAA
jgi:hypothetical protein